MNRLLKGYLNKSKIIHLLIMFAVIITIITAGLVSYYFTLKEQLSENSCNTLSEILEQQRFNVETEIKTYLENIRNLSLSKEIIEARDTADAGLLKIHIDGTKFKSLIVSDKNGNALTNYADTVDVSKRDYFNDVISGNTVTSQPIQTTLNGSRIIEIGAPIYKDENIDGIIIASIETDTFSDLLLPSFDGMGYAFLTTTQGEIIAKAQSRYILTTQNNIFGSWSGARFYKYDNLETIENNVLQGLSGHSYYAIKGQKRMCHYAPVGLNGWYVFVVVPEDVIGASVASISRNAALLALNIVMMFVAFVVYILFIQWRAEKEQRAHTEKLENIAFSDTLTGAPTLAKFKIEAQRLIEENRGYNYIFVKFDVDKFKLINQSQGFDEGDRILKTIVTALGKNTNDKTETYARVNIDEFMILYVAKSDEQFAALQNNFHSCFFKLLGDGIKYNIIFPTGYFLVEMHETDRINVLDAIEKTNIAHRRAKRIGIELCIYDDEMKKAALYQKMLEDRMHTSLQNNDFLVYIQAKYHLKDETLAGGEALVRWRLDEDIISPDVFIPLFENNGFIIKLDMYMFESVCKIIKGWIDDGYKPVPISVNFSSNHLEISSFVDDLCEIASRYAVPHNLLEIELTETVIYENAQTMLAVLTNLHSNGFTLSMDDFGAGYSSLGLLKNIPVDVIKIDRAFFADSKDKHRANVVIESVLSMAHLLDIKTVAEGVETKDYVDYLQNIGCDIVQGYYFSKPAPIEEFTVRMEKDIHKI